MVRLRWYHTGYTAPVPVYTAPLLHRTPYKGVRSGPAGQRCSAVQVSAVQARSLARMRHKISTGEPCETGCKFFLGTNRRGGASRARSMRPRDVPGPPGSNSIEYIGHVGHVDQQPINNQTSNKQSCDQSNKRVCVGQIFARTSVIYGRI